MWRKWVSAGLTEQLIEGRLMGQTFQLPKLGQVVMYCIYGISGEGLSRASHQILSKRFGTAKPMASPSSLQVTSMFQ